MSDISSDPSGAAPKPQWFVLGLLPLMGLIAWTYWRGAPHNAWLRLVAGLCLVGAMLILTFVQDGPYPDDWTNDE